MLNSGPVVRSMPEINMALSVAAQWLAQSDNPSWVRGVIAAYAWVTGQVVEAPVSGEVLTVTLQALRREERLADDAIYGLAGHVAVNQQFAAGAQNALLWLRGADPHPPISLTHLPAPSGQSR